MPHGAAFTGCAVALALLAPSSAAAAPRLKLAEVKGLPANAARDLAVGPGREVWMTSDFTGQFVARISAKGKLLGVFAAPGTPQQITRGPDDAMWFTARTGNYVGRVTRAGAVTRFPVPIPNAEPRGIAAGADGALWVAFYGAHSVGRLSTSGAWTVFTRGLTPGGNPLGMTRGPDGAVWLTEPRADRVTRMAPDGAVTPFFVSNVSGPEEITTGVDGNLWFTEDDGDRIGRVSPSGGLREFQSGITPGGNPHAIGSGPDDAMWFSESVGNRLGRATPDGLITEYRLPAGSTPRAVITGPDRRVWVALAGTGRVVRFRPPLAPVIPATIGYATTTQNGTTSFNMLRVDGIPPRVGRVQVSCTGRGCPLRRYAKRGASRVNLRKKVRRIGAGATLQVRVAARGYATKVRVFKASAGGVDVLKRCIPPKKKRLRRGCG